MNIRMRISYIVMVLAGFLLAGAAVGQAQTFTTLYSFCSQAKCADGQNPSGVLLLAGDGSFYGTATAGGAGFGSSADSAGYGVVFKITPAGALTVVHDFSGTDGATPATGLIAGADGNFYGTDNGFSPNYGSTGLEIAGGIFKMTPSGAVTVLGSVSSSFVLVGNGLSPVSGLVAGPDGNFYGATQIAYNGACTQNCGTVFKVTPGGALTTLHSFDSSEGAAGFSALTLGPDGNFYGEALAGGPELYGDGTIYKITPDGTFTTIYGFSGPDGAGPFGGLTIGPDGNFYGMTEYGGTNPYGGTVFRITPTGVLTTLYNFNGMGLLPYNQPEPNAALVLGPDGNFYGTTPYGGACSYSLLGCSTIFRISPAGEFTSLYTFSEADGMVPITGLTLGGDGNFYGTTYFGGAHGDGAVFRLAIPHTPPSIAPNGIVNAASFAAPVAPGSIATVFGTFAIPALVSASSFPPPTSFSGLSIQFGSAPLAPLFFASPSQINAQIPWELAGQTQTAVSASQYGQSSVAQTVPLATYSPGIFVMNAQTNQGAILDASYNLVGPANPTNALAYVQIYCTGLGPVTNQPATGAPALADPLSWTGATPIVTIGGLTASVEFSGLVPGDVGLYQVNAQVPAGVAKGATVPVAISIGGVTSNTVTMAIQ